jgi:hypothetical protein
MPEVVQNAHVRLLKADTYQDGEPYRDWELLRDCPEIPATRYKAEPPHGVAGDVLREERDEDDLTPFRLKRDGRTIGSPEWFQVRHLFDGIPVGEEWEVDDTSANGAGILEQTPGHLSWTFTRPVRFAHILAQPGASFMKFNDGHGPVLDTTLATSPCSHRRFERGNGAVEDELKPGRYEMTSFEADLLLRLDRIERTPHLVRGLRAFGISDYTGEHYGYPDLAYVVKPIAGTSIRPGDVMVADCSRDRLRGVPGSIQPVDRGGMEAIRAAWEDAEDDLWEFFTPMLGFHYKDHVARLVRNRTRWGMRAKVWSPKLHIVRFLRPEPVVSHPIAASCDDAALFELLCQVGGRMAKPENRAGASSAPEASPEGGRRRGRSGGE